MTPSIVEKLNASAPVAVTVSIVGDAAGLDALESGWNELFTSSPSASPPLRWSWIRYWWGLYGPIYGDGGRGLRIITIWRGSNLIGILPLYEGYKRAGGVSLRRLTFVGAGAAEFEETCVDYLDVLYAKGEAAACMEAITACFVECASFRWQELHLPEISEKSPLAALQSKFSWPLYATELAQTHPCHLFDMEGGFDGYLHRISSENRRQARKMLRDAGNEGLRFEVATSANQADLFFDQMIELHRDRWTSKGKPGSFSPRHAQFNRELVRVGVPCGDVVIARLSKAETPIALIYGHRVGSTLYCFQQGVDTGITKRLRSPGTAAWLMLMREMAPQGIRMFDHMTGHTAFKDRFATGNHQLCDLKIRRVGIRWASYTIADFSLRALRKTARVARNICASPPVNPEEPKSYRTSDGDQKAAVHPEP